MNGTEKGKPSQSFDRLSQSFVTRLSNPGALNKDFYGFTKTSRELYQLLFRNINITEGRIIISPDATYFPFEALLTNNSGQPLSYFVNNHATSYAYSARYLTSYFSNTSSRGPAFLGMAPVRYAARLNLPALPGSDRSLQQLKGNFRNSSYLVAENASRNNFLQQFYRYRIVQLYTHSSSKGDNGEPAIYFRDSALLLSDLIYENKPVTSLIVLSACETGAGKLYQGEGVFSFNRGFAAIGIPSSISNLWQVDNESTYRLTALFYKELAEGLPIDIALQKAKLKFLNTAEKEKQLPYYWAAPILAGQSAAIKMEKKTSWEGWVAGIGCALVLLGGWRIYSNKRNTGKKHSLAERHPVPGTSVENL